MNEDILYRLECETAYDDSKFTEGRTYNVYFGITGDYVIDNYNKHVLVDAIGVYAEFEKA